MKSLQPFFSAVRFLTILPIPERWCGDLESFRKSIDWYPLVGLLIGLLAGVFDLLLCWLLPVPVASAMLLAAMISVARALHMDGLATIGIGIFLTRALKSYSMRKIGGYTGDTLGAASELAELIPALVIVALFHQGLLP